MIKNQEFLTNVIQGEFKVSDRPEEILTTILGSCVAVCLFDDTRCIGGLNHFLLPRRDGAEGKDGRFGAYLMELMINAMLKQGAAKPNLKAKVFGGARMIGNLSDIGQANADFASQFLSDEAIPCIAASTGGTSARRIRFWPATGHAKQMIVSEPPPVQIQVEAPAKAQEITLF